MVISMRRKAWMIITWLIFATSTLLSLPGCSSSDSEEEELPADGENTGEPGENGEENKQAKGNKANGENLQENDMNGPAELVNNAPAEFDPAAAPTEDPAAPASANMFPANQPANPVVPGAQGNVAGAGSGVAPGGGAPAAVGEAYPRQNSRVFYVPSSASVHPSPDTNAPASASLQRGDFRLAIPEGGWGRTPDGFVPMGSVGAEPVGRPRDGDAWR